MLQLYNSLTKKLEIFTPISPCSVGLYVCGTTVYDHCHLGHGRIFVVFDLLYRLFQTLNYQVTYVRNVTDIDDKIIAKAASLGITIEQVTERYYRSMLEDEQALNVLPPTYTPKATEHITEIIAFIERLLAQKAAYITPKGDLYFSVASHKTYGQLAHQNLEYLAAGIRVNLEETKRAPLDFVLWKAAKPNEPAWDSPWGKGRPGWHIECSAMARKYLGNYFDLHGGGVDLLFPHHQNEVAQSETANQQTLANYWIHVGFVQYQQTKMSKSTGNFFTLKELLRHFSGETLRYFYLTSQYQNPIDFTLENLEMADNSLRSLYLALLKSESLENVSGAAITQHPDYLAFFEALEDNLNTPACLAILFKITHDINTLRRQGKPYTLLQKLLKKLGNQLGLFNQVPEQFIKQGVDNNEIESLIQARLAARQAGNWELADQIRAQLKTQGVVLEDQSLQQTDWYVINRKNAK